MSIEKPAFGLVFQICGDGENRTRVQIEIFIGSTSVASFRKFRSDSYKSGKILSDRSPIDLPIRRSTSAAISRSITPSLSYRESDKADASLG